MNRHTSKALAAAGGKLSGGLAGRGCERFTVPYVARYLIAAAYRGAGPPQPPCTEATGRGAPKRTSIEPRTNDVSSFYGYGTDRIDPATDIGHM